MADGSNNIADLVLAACANWRLARKRAELKLAEYDRASLFGNRNAPKAEIAEDIAVMRDVESQLAREFPQGHQQAAKIMEVALDILRSREIDPEVVFSEGPALQILTNVQRAVANEFRNNLY